MKKILNASIVVLFSLGLAACSGEEPDNAMNDLDEAIQNNQTLESATYETSLNTEPEDFNQRAEGAFIALGDDEYNWTHTEYIGGENNFTQITEIDGRQFQLISVDEEGFVPEWQEVEADTHQHRAFIQPLLENTIDAEYFDEIEVTEEDGKQYVITLTDTYTENSTAETIAELEELIAELEAAGEETGYIEALETQIETIENTEYSDPEIAFTINVEGYLVHYLSRYTFTTPEAEPVTVTIQHDITDYNLEDVSNLLPVIE